MVNWRKMKQALDYGYLRQALEKSTSESIEVDDIIYVIEMAIEKHEAQVRHERGE